MVASWSGRLDEANAAGAEAVALARAAGERELLAFVLNDLSRSFMQEGRYAAASLEESTLLFRELGNLAMLTDALGTTAMAALGVGEYDRALAAALEAREIADQIDNDWARSFSGFSRGYIHLDRGDWGTAIEIWEDAIRCGEKAGFLVVRVGPRSDLASLYRAAGAPELADAHLLAARDLAESSLPDQLGWVIASEVRAALAGQDIAEARRLANDLATHRIPRLAFIDSHMDLPVGALELAEGQIDAAIARAAAHAGEPDGGRTPKAFEADWDLLLGRAQLLRGDLAAADAALARGVERARTLGARRVLWPLHRVWADVAEARGDGLLARSRRDEAREHASSIADSLERVGLADRFRALPEVRATLILA